MMRFLYIFFSFLFFFSCSNNHRSSFDSLADSFLKWNLKFSSTPSFLTSHDNILSLNKKFSEDLYLNDIKRFSIELHQINQMKLETPKRLEYLSIKNFLDNNIFQYKKSHFNRWNSLHFLDEAFFHLSYIDYLIKDRSVDLDFISSEIDYLNAVLTYRLKKIELQYSSDIEKNILKKGIEDIQDIFKEINSPMNIPYYKKNLSALEKTIRSMESWHKNKYEKFDLIQNDRFRKDAIEYIPLLTGFRGNLDSLLLDATNNLSLYEKELFDISLSTYLLNNDEPVWVGKEDTMDVVNWTLDSLSRIPYNCSDKMSVIDVVDKTISKIRNYPSSMNLKNILHENNLLGDFDFYKIVDDSLVIYSSEASTNLIDNYYQSLEVIFPGNLHIEKLVNNSALRFNKIYINKNYIEGFKIILIDYYLNYIDHKIGEDEICNLDNSKYIPALKVYFLLDRIKDCLGTISTINYLLYDKDIDVSIMSYDYLQLLKDEEKDFYRKEIFSYDMSSLIKFISYNRLMKLYKSKRNNKERLEEVINVLYENPNSNLQYIERILK